MSIAIAIAVAIARVISISILVAEAIGGVQCIVRGGNGDDCYDDSNDSYNGDDDIQHH